MFAFDNLPAIDTFIDARGLQDHLGTTKVEFIAGTKGSDNPYSPDSQNCTYSIVDTTFATCFKKLSGRDVFREFGETDSSFVSFQIGRDHDLTVDEQSTPNTGDPDTFNKELYVRIDFGNGLTNMVGSITRIDTKLSDTYKVYVELLENIPFELGDL